MLIGYELEIALFYTQPNFDYWVYLTWPSGYNS